MYLEAVGLWLSMQVDAVSFLKKWCPQKKAASRWEGDQTLTQANDSRSAYALSAACIAVQVFLDSGLDASNLVQVIVDIADTMLADWYWNEIGNDPASPLRVLPSQLGVLFGGSGTQEDGRRVLRCALAMQAADDVQALATKGRNALDQQGEQAVDELLAELKAFEDELAGC